MNGFEAEVVSLLFLLFKSPILLKGTNYTQLLSFVESHEIDWSGLEEGFQGPGVFEEMFQRAVCSWFRRGVCENAFDLVGKVGYHHNQGT